MDKKIYKYELDGVTRHADPLRAWNMIQVRLRGDAMGVARRACGPPEGQGEPNGIEIAVAENEIQDAVMEAFALPPFDPETGAGATLAECIRIWDGLMEFLDEAKKKRDS